VYLSMALLLRIRRGRAGWLEFATLGLVLGFGYLAKSVMFVFASAVILVALGLVRMQRIPALRLMLVPILFLVISGPFITAISHQKGRVTIGESGWLPYLFVVNGLPTGYLHPRPPGLRVVFKHPPRQIHSQPAVYEFGSAVGGSCPAWYDPSYWYDGGRIFYVWKNQVWAFLKNVFYYSQILFVHQATLMAGILVLALYAGSPGRFRKDITEHWYLLAPPILVMGVYSVIVVQSRYVGPLLAVSWAALFFSLRIPTSPDAGRIVRSVLLASALVLTVTIALRVASEALKDPPGIDDPARHGWALKDREVAAELNKIGIREGDTVGFIGNSIWVYWAHVAKIRIVAEIPEEDVDAFYRADAATRQSVRRAFASTGAKFVVADRFPSWSESEEWRRLGTTGYWVLLLP
jgi:4-amino-4-deoxy-L-arabinose transferase-like glycosyltransferase